MRVYHKQVFRTITTTRSGRVGTLHRKHSKMQWRVYGEGGGGSVSNPPSEQKKKVT